MNSFKLFIVIFFIMLYLTGCKNSKNEGLQTKIFPQDNILTFGSASDKTVELCFELFCEDEDGGLVKENIEDIFISGDDGVKIPASVTKTVQHSKVAIDEFNIYRTSFTVSINRSDIVNINNASVNIKLKEDEQYTSYELGNLAFIENSEDDRIRQPLEITSLTPVTKEINGLIYTIGLICKLDVADSITINGFDMGIADYGTDKIYALDEDYDSVVASQDKQELDKLIRNIYDITVSTTSSDQINSIKLDEGIHTVVIKLNMAQNARVLSTLGGNLIYTYKSANYTAIYNGYKKVTAMSYSEDLLKKTIYKDYFTNQEQ